MADDDDLGEQFLQANSNVDYMASHLADCLRNCMRAVAATEPSSATYKAVQDFDMLLKLLVRSKGIRFGELFDKAIAELRPERAEPTGEGSAYRYYEHTILTAAETGLQLLVESSCADNAAKGRTSSRRSDFLSAIKSIDEAHKGVVIEAQVRWPGPAPAPTKPRKPRKS